MMCSDFLRNIYLKLHSWCLGLLGIYAVPMISYLLRELSLNESTKFIVIISRLPAWSLDLIRISIAFPSWSVVDIRPLKISEFGVGASGDFWRFVTKDRGFSNVRETWISSFARKPGLGNAMWSGLLCVVFLYMEDLFLWLWILLVDDSSLCGVSVILKQINIIRSVVATAGRELRLCWAVVSSLNPGFMSGRNRLWCEHPRLVFLMWTSCRGQPEQGVHPGSAGGASSSARG